MHFRLGTRRLYGLSSRNTEVVWTFVQEHGGCMDFHPGTRRLYGLSSRNTEVVWTFVQEPEGRMDLQGDLLDYLVDSKSTLSGRLSLIAR
ncbi:hypothetical protein Bca52824_033043 [Brassica carinata]|uniref:Uncharacterized protein n=1 Tax=Brassica carinata TaxID=52824 RepID=A0A8X7SE88_BRACI|nr:hypothetical protein Bca52824_033043 [Brassica carinata]